MFPELDDVLEAAARVDSVPAPRPPRLRRDFVPRSGSFATMEEIDRALDRALDRERNPGPSEAERERERWTRWRAGKPWPRRVEHPHYYLSPEELAERQEVQRKRDEQLAATARTPEEINASFAAEVAKFVHLRKVAQ